MTNNGTSLPSSFKNKVGLRDFGLPLLIFLVALSIRIINVLEFKNHDPLFEQAIPGLDMYHYSKWIMNILNTRWVDREYLPFEQGPLYPYAVAFAMNIFGTGILRVKILQAVMGSVSCVLAYFTGKKVFGVRAGIVSALLMSFYGMFLLYEAELLMETMITFLNLLAILTLLIAREKGRLFFYILAGFCLALTIICRPNTVLFVPLALLWIWVYAEAEKKRRKVVAVASFVCGIAIAIAPVTLKNYLVGGEFVPVCKQGGLNFYVGNCYDATGTLSYNEAVTKIAPAIVYMPVTDIARIDWYGELWKEISEDPPRFLAHFIRLMGKKFLFFWGSYELPNNVNYYLSKQFSSVLRLPLLEYWQILPFAIVGILVGLKKGSGPILLLFFMFAFMASILILMVVARYRLPMVPFFMIFAGYVPVWWYENIKRKDFKKVSLSLIPLILVGLFSIATRSDHIREGDYFNVGLGYQSRGLYRSAAAEYVAALKVNPEFMPARKNLIYCYLTMHSPENALAVSMEGARLEPYNAEQFYYLALVLKEKGEVDAAIGNLERSIVLDPRFIPSRKMLAGLYSSIGEYSHAKAQWRKVLEIDRDDKEAVEKLRNLKKLAPKS